jgi:hypothetical protein
MSIKFCVKCGALMDKLLVGNKVEFKCVCQNVVLGAPEDTLLAEETVDNLESYKKHDAFIENSPHDAARCIVMKNCPTCNLNFLTMIRIGTDETVVYVCKCGFRATSTQYEKMN